MTVCNKYRFSKPIQEIIFNLEKVKITYYPLLLKSYKCFFPLSVTLQINKTKKVHEKVKKTLMVISKMHLLCSLQEIQINIINHVLCLSCEAAEYHVLVSSHSLRGYFHRYTVCSVAKMAGCPSVPCGNIKILCSIDFLPFRSQTGKTLNTQLSVPL